MPDTAVSQLEPRLQNLAANARRALAQGHLDYVLEASAEILKTSPGCLAVRKLQHSARVQRYREGGVWAGKTRGALARVGLILGRHQSKPESSLVQAEAILATDPLSPAGLRQLAAAAEAADWPQTAIHALECLVEVSPGEVQAGLELGEACLRVGKLMEALAVAEALVQRHPQDGAALALLRKVSVAQTLQQGNWESGGSFREKLRE